MSRPAAPALSVPSLPRPFCPPTSPTPHIAALRHRFLQLNAPLIFQPQVDIDTGNGFVALFYHFDDAASTCVCSLVFESEASYNFADETKINHLGTFCYRSHNYRSYHRTAVRPPVHCAATVLEHASTHSADCAVALCPVFSQDINHLAYHGCRLPVVGDEDAAVQWQSLHTTDGSGVQQWSKGDKKRFLHFFSLSRHYDVEVRREGWRTWQEAGAANEQTQGAAFKAKVEEWRREDERSQRSGLTAEARVEAIVAGSRASASSASASPFPGRPCVFVNVMNHLMAPFCTNPHLSYRVHVEYPMFPGDRSVAERFAQLCIAYKWTLFSFIPNALYSPLKRDMREERTVWSRLHHSHLLSGRHTAEEGKDQETQQSDAQ